MSITVTCSCGKQLNARDNAAGKRVRCPYCDKVLLVPIPALETSDFDIQVLGLDTTHGGGLEQESEPFPASKTRHKRVRPLAVEGEVSRREYKVLSRQDQWFTGKFHPNDLEVALNAYAQQGWAVHTIFRVANSEPDGEEIVVVLER